jgi:hypothetical protein
VVRREEGKGVKKSWGEGMWKEVLGVEGCIGMDVLCFGFMALG